MMLKWLACLLDTMQHNAKDYKSDLTKVHTEGNYSYIPININQAPQDISTQILKTLKSFAEQRDLFIISYYIEKQQPCEYYANYTHGIWVNHIPINQTRQLPLPIGN